MIKAIAQIYEGNPFCVNGIDNPPEGHAFGYETTCLSIELSIAGSHEVQLQNVIDASFDHSLICV